MVTKILPQLKCERLVETIWNFDDPAAAKLFQTATVALGFSGVTMYLARRRRARIAGVRGVQNSARRANTRSMVPLSPSTAVQVENTRATSRCVVDETISNPAAHRRMTGKCLIACSVALDSCQKRQIILALRGHVLDAKFGPRYDVTQPFVFNRIRQHPCDSWLWGGANIRSSCGAALHSLCPARSLYFWFTMQTANVVSVWECGQQRFAPYSSQMFWDRWTLQCFRTKTYFHPKASAPRSEFCFSREHTRSPLLSSALAMVLTMNARRFQRTHPLRGMGDYSLNRQRILIWELLTCGSEPVIDAVCTAVVGSARTGRTLDAGSAREDRSSDVYCVGDTRQSFFEKDDDSIQHTHHICQTTREAPGYSTSCPIAR